MSYENERDPRANGGHLNAVDYSSATTQTSAKQSLQHACIRACEQVSESQVVARINQGNGRDFAAALGGEG